MLRLGETLLIYPTPIVNVVSLCTLAYEREHNARYDSNMNIKRILYSRPASYLVPKRVKSKMGHALLSLGTPAGGYFVTVTNCCARW